MFLKRHFMFIMLFLNDGIYLFIEIKAFHRVVCIAKPKSSNALRDDNPSSVIYVRPF